MTYAPTSTQLIQKPQPPDPFYLAPGSTGNNRKVGETEKCN